MNKGSVCRQLTVNSADQQTLECRKETNIDTSKHMYILQLYLTRQQTFNSGL